jgi:hypothetical protein
MTTTTQSPRIFQPTPEALARLNDYHNRIVDRRRGDLHDLTSYAARWAEQAWRLAVVLHAGLHGARAHEHQLADETAANAVRLAQWFADQQVDILAKGRRHASQKKEEEVLELLATRGDRQKIDYVTARDVHRARIVNSAQAAAALLVRMEKDGILTGEDVRPEHGGKTTRIFRAVAGKNPVPE